MAVKRRLSGYAGMRFDWPHIRSMESAMSFDIDSVLRGLVTGLNKPYVIRGFKVKIPAASQAANTLQIEVKDSALLHSSASESGTILTVESDAQDEILNSANSKVIGSFQNGVTNYIALDYARESDTSIIDQTAGWSPSQQVELQRTVPIGRTMSYRFIITTSGFGSYLPLYIVGVNSTGSVTYITKAAPSLFRLGTGGSVPDPQAKFTFKSLVNPQTGTRREWVNTNAAVSNPVSVVPGDDASAFDFGDWSITSLKEWMDAMMTRIREITGSPYWYVDAALSSGVPQSLFNVWWDAAGSAMTGTGNLSFNLILESSSPTSGKYQTKLTDSSIIVGDSYVKGASSGTVATLSAYNVNQLVINSLNNPTGFIAGETVYNRRLVRFNPSLYELEDFDDTVTQFGHYRRVPAGTGSYTTITAWSYVAKVVTITASGHGLSVGDIVEVKDLVATTNAPNGVHAVKEVNGTSFSFTVSRIPTGSPTLGGSPGVRLDNQAYLPYVPQFAITAWSYVGTTITLTAPNHTYSSPVVTSGDTNSGNNTILNIPSTASLKVGMSVAGAGISAGTYITKIVNATSITMSQNASATASAVTLTFADYIVVQGLTSTTNAPNGRWIVSSVNGSGQIVFTASGTPTGTAAVSAASKLTPDYIEFLMTVSDATPADYNQTDQVASGNSIVDFYYPVGLAALPDLAAASGAIEFDGVVAVSTVSNPIKIKSIANSGADIIVKTFAPHGESAGGPKDITIYGTQTISNFIRTYSGITIVAISAVTTSLVRASNVVTVVTATAHDLAIGESVQISGVTSSTFNGTFVVTAIDSATQFKYAQTAANDTATIQGTVTNLNHFKITGSGLPSAATYTNGGSDDVYLRFPNNPYAGPIQWDSDIYIKGAVGDKYFKIPLAAIATGTSNANKFNNNGLTGTAYLLDGEVAYIVLQRNKSVSSGQTFSCAGGAAAIVGSSTPLDESGNPLVAGDFVKFSDEDEGKWIRIASVLGNNINTVTDRGVAPDITQRPAKSGQLVYSKGSYDTVTVKPHYLVEPNADIYWLAIRRDNGSSRARVYLKSMELEQGESRQINDNEPSNLLIYTGAGTEAAVNPNYSLIDTSSSWQATQSVTVQAKDLDTREVTFVASPELGFQIGDKFSKTSGSTTYNFTILQVLTQRTVVVEEDVTPLSASDVVTYYRLNKTINDSDNLTLALRKEDRELARINSAISRPIYDESAFVQQINLSGAGTIRSGSFIYLGTQANPTALAWVLHGNAAVNETIEGATVAMPGGHASVGASAILVHIYSGTFTHGSSILQNGAAPGPTVNNVGNPAFSAPALTGGGPTGVELALPPNRRTQVFGASYVVFPTHAAYKASLDSILTGEDLLVIANDTLRRAETDYQETFGGPKGKIRLVRNLPANTTLRFRTLSSIGSAVSVVAGATNLQSAYNAGRVINTALGQPVEINAADYTTAGVALKMLGRLEIEGRVGGVATNGIFGPQSPNVDQAFVVGNESNKPKEVWSGLNIVKTHTGFTGSAWTNKTAGQVTTSGSATMVSGSDVFIPLNTTVRVCMTAVGRDSANAGSAAFRMEGLFKRAAGAVSAVGSPTTILISSDGNCVSSTFAFGLADLAPVDAVVDSVVGVLFGPAAATVYWTVTIEYQIVATST